MRAASRRSSTRTPSSRRTRAVSILALGPLFNKDAFTPVSAFNYNYGTGNRVEESIRGFAYTNQDFTIMKNTRMGGGTNLQLRLEVFNLWNWHSFQANGQWGNQAFNTDINSPELRAVE